MSAHASDAEAVQTIARALADPHRYQIVRMLAQSSACVPCSSFQGQFPITAPTFSHHMRELRDAGLVGERRTGRTMNYWLRRDVLEAFLSGLERDLLPQALPATHCAVPAGDLDS